MRQLVNEKSYIYIIISFVLMIAYLLPAILLSTLPIVKERVLTNTVNSLLFGIGSSIIMTVTVILLTDRVSRKILHKDIREIGLVFTRKSLGYFLLGWLVVGIGIVIVRFIAIEFQLPTRSNLAVSRKELGNGLLFLSIVYNVCSSILVQGFPEELIWRGFLLNALKAKPRKALLISASAFSLLHLVSSGGQENLLERLIYVLGVFGFALLAGVLAIKTHSLWSAVGVHAGMHLTNLCLALSPWNVDGPVIWGLQFIVLTTIAFLLLNKDKEIDILYFQ